MIKAGILGGGQLGRMLLQAAANYPVQTFIMENDPECPAAHLCHHFVQGNIRNAEEVYRFGKQLDVLTIEIENVNTNALERLEAEGVKVIPRPSVLKTIKNKILQKEFYALHQIPTSPFVITNNKEEITKYPDFFPAVHKLGEGGYDGKGVQVLEGPEDLEKAFDAPAVLEKKISIKKEIAQMIAVGQNGETAVFPPVEMVFDPELNLLDYQLCPAEINEKTLWKVEAITHAIARNLKSPGLFAVEMFLDKEDEVWVNETAPRVHNSGHHTIEAHYSSQFDMLWRVMLNYPLGNTRAILPSAMVNIIGEKGFTGEAKYEGLTEVLKFDNVFVHIYGKKITKPGRKMGHVTILSQDKQELIYRAGRIKHLLKVKA
ncbi:MAG: 5-(carboxyamino)imidazole ribonucleotide synthase [Chitinophagaceae bacterium]|nr:5-(carboxyamino)imidazole ribonucleotide synthase [Chitinophagaceae bacterium]